MWLVARGSCGRRAATTEKTIHTALRELISDLRSRPDLFQPVPQPHPRLKLSNMAPIVVIDALPKFTTPEEHRSLVASTPASFSDIPPVLRHKEDNVSITLDPTLDSFSTEDCASGTLYVLERCVELAR